eukprot:CAMPEP_0197453578 /NCGR_PEP_ID=MMETSP1175-20131217/35316_1 /TAXON_ID=1003142 /ORGANISM="Triceratium dubium, Strain CCMP147" /LENGTH=196 /DNA_ID=CAMNT_0042986905 /DNA_START=25 /DNA_END=611 /DNA_ORIENTATION=+
MSGHCGPAATKTAPHPSEGGHYGGLHGQPATVQTDWGRARSKMPAGNVAVGRPCRMMVPNGAGRCGGIAWAAGDDAGRRCYWRTEFAAETRRRMQQRRAGECSGDARTAKAAPNDGTAGARKGSGSGSDKAAPNDGAAGARKAAVVAATARTAKTAPNDGAAGARKGSGSAGGVRRPPHGRWRQLAKYQRRQQGMG